MYSPDQADIDPRNTMNLPDAKADRFLLNESQFSAEELEVLEGNTDVDHVFDDEGQARDAAFAIARKLNKPVEIECGTGEKFDYEWFDVITVKPEVKVA